VKAIWAKFKTFLIGAFLVGIAIIHFGKPESEPTRDQSIYQLGQMVMVCFYVIGGCWIISKVVVWFENRRSKQ
jgi:hypothetical protein